MELIDPAVRRRFARPVILLRRALGGLALVAMLAAAPAQAQDVRATAAYWKAVQAKCDATAAKPPSGLGKRIAQSAIDEFHRFGGHRIDANGRLFHFGLTEAEHEEDDGGELGAKAGKLGWWQVMKYWRSLYQGDPTDKLEVRGYRDASSATDESQTVALLRTSAARLLKLAEGVTDPDERELVRQNALRAAVLDTSWSAAFVSHVVRQAGVTGNAFAFSNAHRAYIYDAFGVSAAEQKGGVADNGKLYRACPLNTTRPRVGDMLCQQREPSLADATDVAVRERIRGELASGGPERTIRRTHCEIVTHIDARARKVYTIGGNVNQSVTARKLNLSTRRLKFPASQKGYCGGAGAWTLPEAAGGAPRGAQKCSLNDRKWFVLLQLR
jgi:hypothetical protein